MRRRPPVDFSDKKLWKLYPKQLEAYRLIEESKFSLLIGQGRASKTTLAVFYCIARALLNPQTSHVIFRNTLNSAIDGIWAQTIPEVMEHFFPIIEGMPGFSKNETKHTIYLPGGSRLMIRGLDTPARAGKVLSQQFATVIFDECQTIELTYLGLLLTRLPQPKMSKYEVKLICTANYAPRTHWTRAFFADGVNPSTGTPHKQKTGLMHFVTEDNKAIDAESYIDTIKNAGDRAARLMCAGTDWFVLTEGALWKPQDIRRGQEREYDEIILSFDPATTDLKTSDAHGISVCARKGNYYYVIESFEKQEDVNVMAQMACSLHNTYKCTRLVYEKNQGGDWIEALIRQHDPTILCDKVHATKGKILRAEPVAALYKAGRVFHTQLFDTVEDQMMSFAGSGKSPNSLDSLVHGITWLETMRERFADPNAI